MGLGLRTEVGLDDDDIQRLSELFVQQLRLVKACLDSPFHGGLFEILLRHVGVIDLAAILTMSAMPGC